MTLEIKCTNGKWLINGKPYNELQPDEQRFFEEFLSKMKRTLQKSKS